MINGLSPNTFKDCTYSSSLMESTWDLAIRKQEPQPQMMKIITIFFALCPIIATSIITRISCGMDMNTFGDPDHKAVEPAASVSAVASQENADKRTAQGASESDRDGHAAAVQDSRKYIPADLIRPKPVLT